jgi:hypothetical protein
MWMSSAELTMWLMTHIAQGSRWRWRPSGAGLDVILIVAGYFSDLGLNGGSIIEIEKIYVVTGGANEVEVWPQTYSGMDLPGWYLDDAQVPYARPHRIRDEVFKEAADAGRLARE